MRIHTDIAKLKSLIAKADEFEQELRERWTGATCLCSHLPSKYKGRRVIVKSVSTRNDTINFHVYVLRDVAIDGEATGYQAETCPDEVGTCSVIPIRHVDLDSIHVRGGE